MPDGRAYFILITSFSENAAISAHTGLGVLMGETLAKLDFLAEKPARLHPVDEFVSPGELQRLTKIPDLVIGELAGRDSAAAIILAVEDGAKDVLPTYVYTGTEYGNWAQLDDNLAFLAEALELRRARLHPPIALGDPRLWAAICGRFSGEIATRYGPCGFCAGCHLYMHLCRVPLALRIGSKVIVSGERESHQGRLKLNQTAPALDAYIDVLSAAGICLSMPLRFIENNAEIEKIVGPDWPEGGRQLDCVLGRNYEDPDGGLVCDLARFRDFLSEFLVPAGKRLLETVLGGGSNYNEMVSRVLKAGGP